MNEMRHATVRNCRIITFLELAVAEPAARYFGCFMGKLQGVWTTALPLTAKCGELGWVIARGGVTLLRLAFASIT